MLCCEASLTHTLAAWLLLLIISHKSISCIPTVLSMHAVQSGYLPFLGWALPLFLGMRPPMHARRGTSSDLWTT